mgnify:CR=1 FL=1|jgi:hypothetical protein|tara:strand:- start:4498 stop:4626 length:129 start_codon:yes stop_codon:yes gene_type:complete
MKKPSKKKVVGKDKGEELHSALQKQWANSFAMRREGGKAKGK